MIVSVIEWATDRVSEWAIEHVHVHVIAKTYLWKCVQRPLWKEQLGAHEWAMRASELMSQWPITDIEVSTSCEQQSQLIARWLAHFLLHIFYWSKKIILSKRLEAFWNREWVKVLLSAHLSLDTPFYWTLCPLPMIFFFRILFDGIVWCWFYLFIRVQNFHCVLYSLAPFS